MNADHKELIVLCLTFLACNTVFGQVRLTVRDVNVASQLKTITFNVSRTDQFYNCLCGNTTENCTVGYDPALNAIRIDPALFTGSSLNNSEEFSNFYSCSASDQSSSISCRKQRHQDVLCSQPQKLSTFSLLRQNACELGCVGFQWRHERESLTSTSPNTFESCHAECNEETTTAPSTTAVISSTVKAVPKSGDDDNDDVIVVGVVLGLLLLVSLVIIAILLWKMRRQIMDKMNFGTDSKTADNPRNSTKLNRISRPVDQKEIESTFDDGDVYENTETKNSNDNNRTSSSDSRNANQGNVASKAFSQVEASPSSLNTEETYINQGAGGVQATTGSIQSRSAPNTTYSQLNEGEFPSVHNYSPLTNDNAVYSNPDAGYNNSLRNNDTYEDL